MILLALAAALLQPNGQMTPGQADSTITQEQLCPVAHTARRRNVTTTTRIRVFQRYNVDPISDKFEVDHLISLELGGTNDISNLWPQSYTTKPYNARMKDALENRLHSMVCRNQIPLQQAQHEIATDWISAYHRYVQK